MQVGIDENEEGIKKDRITIIQELKAQEDAQLKEARRARQDYRNLNERRTILQFCDINMRLKSLETVNFPKRSPRPLLESIPEVPGEVEAHSG